ncbi:hypothetical protein [Planctomycetes bacterium K23_9]|uniref:Uncharacterized protein n=1 Tax=Stieleria marina TaxID=1930275 RepID=A0A517NWM9_9BACT|nr:hypothetical protein K239x_34940 [Planctomycetes bacterium K23_9]
MARVGIIFGLLLCGLTLVALLCTTHKMPSLFVPMMFGIPILFCGIVGLNPHRRKYAMFNAVAVGTVGFMVGAGLVVRAGMSVVDDADIRRYVIRLGLSLAGLCLVFVASYVVSFLQSRARVQE